MRAERPLPPACSAELARQLAGLQWLELSLVHELQADLPWPGFGGALWHSALGAALNDIDAVAFEALFGGDDDEVRLWSLVPPLVQGEEWIPAGVRVTTLLRLVGLLMPLAGACVAAFAGFERRGLGRERVAVRLVDVRLNGPLGECALGGSVGAVWNGLDLWRDAQAEARDAPLALACRTPLRLKRDGRLLDDAPPLETLLRRAIGRTARLLPSSGSGGEGEFMAAGERAAWLDWALQVPLLRSEATSAHVARWSARQQREMVFEGVAGRWLYGAPAARALPWLRLAQALQIGAKTTFGFGAVECRPSCGPLGTATLPTGAGSGCGTHTAPASTPPLPAHRMPAQPPDELAASAGRSKKPVTTSS